MSDNNPDSVEFDKKLNKVRECGVKKLDRDILIKTVVCKIWVYNNLEDRDWSMALFFVVCTDREAGKYNNYRST